MTQHLINKNIIVFVLILIGLTTYIACHNQGNTMPPQDKFLDLTLHSTAEELYDNNLEFENFQKLTKGPIGRDQKGFDFPRGSKVSAKFNYPNGQLVLNNISFINVMDDTRIENYRLPKFIIVTFLRGQNPDHITDQEAYQQVQDIFKQLEEQGWEYNLTIDAPRITPENAVKYALVGGNASFLDFRYPLTLEQFNQITSYIHRWYLRHGTDTFLEIEMWRNTEENGDTTILFAYEFHDQLSKIKRFVETENQPTAITSFANHFANPPFNIRLSDEDKVVSKDIPIDKTLTSHTFPVVKEQTGFDTANLINTDPYKITFEEFIKRSEAGEDMTPYYEN